MSAGAPGNISTVGTRGKLRAVADFLCQMIHI